MEMGCNTSVNNVNNIFPVLLVCQKEELAFVFEMLQQFEDALVQYDELDALFSQYVVNFGAGGKCLKMWNKCWVYEFLRCAEQLCALGSHSEAALGSLCSSFMVCATSGFVSPLWGLEAIFNENLCFALMGWLLQPEPWTMKLHKYWSGWDTAAVFTANC